MNNLKDLINYINSNFKDNEAENISKFYSVVLKYDEEDSLTIDESLEILEKCPKISQVIAAIKGEGVYFNSSLFHAYNIVHESDSLEQTDKVEALKKYEESIDERPAYELSSVEREYIRRYSENDEEERINSMYYSEFDLEQFQQLSRKDIDLVKLYLSQLNYGVLSREEEVELFKEYKEQGSEEAREKIVKHNLRLAVSVATNYVGRGLDLLDLIQEANCALLRAIEKFDYRKGYKFSTYAIWWLRQGVTRGLSDKSRVIRIPFRAVEIIGKMKKYIEEIKTRTGEEPSKDELKLKFKIPDKSFPTYYKVLKSGIVVSLDKPINNEGGDSTLGDFVSDENNGIEDYLDNTVYTELRNDLEKTTILTDRERAVLKMRFGFDGKVMTLEEVGKKFNVTRERIRQIETKALKKLRHNHIFKQYNPKGNERSLILK